MPFRPAIARRSRRRPSRSCATSWCPRIGSWRASSTTSTWPKTRDSIAAADLPNGKAYYDFLARYYTTTDLSAAQIHAIGLKEVARIRAEMEKVKDQTGFKGSMARLLHLPAQRSEVLRKDARRAARPITGRWPSASIPSW